jgi:hypothetical protein
MENLEPSYMEGPVAQLLGETAWQFLNRVKTELPYDLASPLLGIYPKVMKITVHTETCA